MGIQDDVVGWAYKMTWWDYLMLNEKGTLVPSIKFLSKLYITMGDEDINQGGNC